MTKQQAIGEQVHRMPTYGLPRVRENDDRLRGRIFCRSMFRLAAATRARLQKYLAATVRLRSYSIDLIFDPETRILAPAPGVEKTWAAPCAHAVRLGISGAICRFAPDGKTHVPEYNDTAYGGRRGEQAASLS